MGLMEKILIFASFNYNNSGHPYHPYICPVFSNLVNFLVSSISRGNELHNLTMHCEKMYFFLFILILSPPNSIACRLATVLQNRKNRRSLYRPSLLFLYFLCPLLIISFLRYRTLSYAPNHSDTQSPGRCNT